MTARLRIVADTPPAHVGNTHALGIDSGDIAAIAAALRAGEIIAIKGTGGYHLACDATNEHAVAELRARKGRDAQPFAVMVADVEAAGVLGDFDAPARELLASEEAPIVLAPKRASAVAASIAPGVPDIGVMLPHMPLHAALVRALPGMPLVMTSGNAANEPVAYLDDDARERLSAIADRIVADDRTIRVRCEDSVARIVDGVPLLLRRGRGYVQTPERIALPVQTPTLALGGHRNAAFALGADHVAYVSPPIGDLDELAAYDAFVAAIEQLGRLHRITPQQVVCDMHPDYATTRLAETLGMPIIRVQHHHAHFASAFADARLHGPAIGVIFDGAGYGGDGTLWGGEILVGDPAAVWRAAHLQTVAQPGGELTPVEPWRMAVSHLAAAGEPYADVHPDAERAAASLVRATQTSSAGRLIDAVTVIAGLAVSGAFPGHAGMLLEAAARGTAPEPAYPFELSNDEMVVAPMIRAIARDARMHVAPSRIARRFHTTLVEMIAHACAQLARGEGLRDVVLSGGVFQNAILATEVPARLRSMGLVPHVHRRMPTNDGGLAFGQLAVAAAREGLG